MIHRSYQFPLEWLDYWNKHGFIIHCLTFYLNFTSWVPEKFKTFLYVTCHDEYNSLLNDISNKLYFLCDT